VSGIVIHPPADIERLRRAGRVARATLTFVGERLRAGISTADIDRWVREDTARRGARPSQLGYRAHAGGPAFPAAVCTSRNEIVCHGIPSPTDILKDGDIINVDVTSELDGFHGDTSETYLIGEVSPDARHVVAVARASLAAAIGVIREGARLGDIGAAIEELARAHGCGVVRDFGGHGIGRAMHMEPHVSHVGPAGRGVRLRAGMVFTIEPMITIGWPPLRYGADGWTVYTSDRTPSAQCEHTVLVTKDGSVVLTSLDTSAAPTANVSSC
jgi:methionyl aminopeptidase